MKKIVILFLIVSSLFSVDYETLYLSKGKGYENSGVRVSGGFSNYSCSERYIDKEYRRKEKFCSVVLGIHTENLNKSVTVEVGSTWENDFKNAKYRDTFSFDCTYRGNLSRFKDCR